MQDRFFWTSWQKDYRLIWYVLSFLLLSSITLLWIFYFRGDANVIDWEKIQEQKVVETTVHSFKLGPFTLSTPSESYVIFEYLGGSELHHNFLASYIFLGVLAISVIVLLAIITTLERFWFFAGLSVFVLFMIGLRLEVLQIFGFGNYTVPGVVLATYLLTAYYFRYIRPTTSYIIRIGVFAVITLVFAVIGGLYTTVAYPVLHLVVTAYTPAIFLTILFIIMVAHEILVGFVYVTNQATAGKNVGHFALISAIYIVNLIITYSHEIGSIHWNFVYINLFLLITISGILGIWGFRQREVLYGNILPFAPFGAFFFVALGTICFITIAQLMGNANDAALQVIRYVIIFCHAGFGIIFMIYFFSNFLVVMGNNLPVYQILYRPARMPYFTFRFAGVIATLAFLFYSNWHSFVDHGVAGFYNYVADMHWMEGNEPASQNFYEQSKSLSFQNHRANYMLGVIKSDRMNFEGALRNYNNANGKHPSAYSLANEGNLNFWVGQYYEGLKSYRTSEKVLPESEVIKNNLGFAYAKVHNLDSASINLGIARENSLTRDAAESNFMAMAAMELIPMNTDSVLKYFNSESAAVQGNALALATLFNQKIDVTLDPLKYKQLDLYSATFLNNYINYNVKTLDTAFLSRANRIASDSLNVDYREALKASLAHAYYLQGNVYRAMEILGELAYITQNHQGKFNYIMGLWALEQGSPKTAASYFSFAETSSYKLASFYKAIALTEAGSFNEATLAWDSLIARNEEPYKTLGQNLKTILLSNVNAARNFNDADKYQFCRYKLGVTDSSAFNNLVKTFTNDNYRAQALLDYSKKFYKAGMISTAYSMFSQTSGLELSDPKLYDDLKHFDLLLLAAKKDVASLQKQIQGVKFGLQQKLEEKLYTALVLEAKGQQAEAEKIYNELSSLNPFFEEGILAAADYYQKNSVNKTKAYDILVEAIYVNPNAVRLLKAYIAEARRIGFDEYADSASQRLIDLE